MQQTYLKIPGESPASLGTPICRYGSVDTYFIHNMTIWCIHTESSVNLLERYGGILVCLWCSVSAADRPPSAAATATVSERGEPHESILIGACVPALGRPTRVA